MAPYFLRNLIPRKEAQTNSRPLLQVLLGLTWVQWAHFLMGSVGDFFLNAAMLADLV